MLGLICLAVGVLNLVIVGVQTLRGQAPAKPGVLASGFGALTLGIIMVALGKQKPTSDDQ